MNLNKTSTETTEIPVPEKIVIEIGSAGIPSAFCAERGIQQGERYISIDDEEQTVRWEKEKFKDTKGFEVLRADARKLPFPDKSVDEMIFNNVFGSYSQHPEIAKAFLAEASRVLKPGGRVHITEMNTPSSVPEEWFIGGRPNKKSHAVVIANPEYFGQFGFTVEKLSTRTKDIEIYRRRWTEIGDENGLIPFYKDAFTLTLVKV
jgi:ubiquinone/menaquinone biosynthesis C-methylase UbiE